MREIRFRAWYEEEKEMQSVIDIYFNKNKGDIESFVTKGKKATYHTDVHTHKLMQYTGSKDKNGVEIYEGDIIHFKHNQMAGLGFVYFNEEVAQWWIKDIREVTKKRGQRYYPFWKDCQYRIDGNIYENPELLETKKSS